MDSLTPTAPLETLEFEIKTYGCKVNSYDSGLLENRLQAGGLVRQKQNPKVYILNTCAVTAEATKEAVRQVRRLKSQSPFSKVVITGCAAQVDTDKFEDVPGVDLIVANSHKTQMETLVRDLFKGKLNQKVFKSNIFKNEELGLGGGTESRHTRSFLKIQDGCNSFCTFCIIPFARGKSRSLPVLDLVNKVESLYDEGVREVVLTGVHIGDYEYNGLKLEDLLERVLKTRMPRVRLTSLEPIELSERLLELFAHESMCPHFHISLQSAHTRVLKDMKRAYGRKQVEWALNEIQKRYPKSFVGMDIIAGFPGETDDEFIETVETMKALPWTRMHVFPYSPRPGVYANRIEGQWERSLIMNRARILRELSQERVAKSAEAQVGQVKNVLVLNRGEQGLSRDYWKVEGETLASLPCGKEHSLKIKGYTELAGDMVLKV